MPTARRILVARWIATRRVSLELASGIGSKVLLTRLPEIQKHDARRVADGGIMAGEVEAAGLEVHTEDGNIVRSLIATAEKLAGRIEVKAPRIIPACPFFPDKCQITV